MDVMETMAMVNSLRGNTVDSVGDDNLTASIIDRSITEISDDAVTKVGDYAFYGCKALTKADFSAATSIRVSAFQRCSILTTVDFPAVTSIGDYAFHDCRALTTVDFPAVTSIASDAFKNCTALTTADFPAVTSIGGWSLSYCSVLTALILRNTEAVCTLSATNAFTNTPIANGTGYIYVPAALIDTYKAATNWSTYAAQFRALEDYTVDGTTTGALDETKI